MYFRIFLPSIKILFTSRYGSNAMVLTVQLLKSINFTTLQRHNELRMAPRARSKFGAPMFEADVFRKQMYCIEESRLLVTLLGLFGAPCNHSTSPAFIWRPRNCAPLPSRYVPAMGVGRIFSRGGAAGDFPIIFSRGVPKVLKFGFYPSKLKKQPFLLIISNTGGALAPPVLPSDDHGPCHLVALITAI